MPYFVVSLDGGGVRGVYQARVIERLQQKAPFLHRVNFFCGTSIGAANAAILAKRRASAGLVDMYRNYAKEIFGFRVRRSDGSYFGGSNRPAPPYLATSTVWSCGTVSSSHIAAGIMVG